MKLNSTPARHARDFWALSHRPAASRLRHALRRAGDSTAPRAGRTARRHDLQTVLQMRGKRRAMGGR